MRTIIPMTMLATALACSLGTAPANARARVFVASYGDDANPCTFGSPCKTFQVAVNAVDAGGEVTAIDSAGFGPIIINKSVTITSPDGVEAGIVPVSGGSAITVAAGNADVVLRGLTLDGAGIGHNGISVLSTGSLTVVNCVIQNFLFDGANGNTGNGILIQPSSGTILLAVTETKLLNNGQSGILWLPVSSSTASAKLAIDHVVASGNNSAGIDLDTLAAAASVQAMISDSILSGNTSDGIAIRGAVTTKVSIENVKITGSNFGIEAFATVHVILGHSMITDNGIGIQNNTSPNTFFTYQDNHINLNLSDIAGPMNTSFAPQ